MTNDEMLEHCRDCDALFRVYGHTPTCPQAPKDYVDLAIASALAAGLDPTALPGGLVGSRIPEVPWDEMSVVDGDEPERRMT